MAKISSFNKKALERYSVHDEIDADYYLFERDGKKLFQMNTKGRTNREKPGKVSQSMQLDRRAAGVLVEILRSHFDI